MTHPPTVQNGVWILEPLRSTVYLYWSILMYVEHANQGVGSPILGTYLDRSPFQMSWKFQSHPWPFLEFDQNTGSKPAPVGDGQLAQGPCPTNFILRCYFKFRKKHVPEAIDFTTQKLQWDHFAIHHWPQTKIYHELTYIFSKIPSEKRRNHRGEILQPSMKKNKEIQVYPIGSDYANPASSWYWNHDSRGNRT